MNNLSRKDAVALGNSLNFPEVVLDIIGGEVPDSLLDYFSTPMVFDLSEEEQSEYGFGRILPLWSSPNGDVIFAYDLSNNDYFSFLWSGGVKARFSSWDDLLKENVSRVTEVVWDDQTEIEVLEVIKEIFDDFGVVDIEGVFKSVLR